MYCATRALGMGARGASCDVRRTRCAVVRAHIASPPPPPPDHSVSRGTLVFIPWTRGFPTAAPSPSRSATKAVVGWRRVGRGEGSHKQREGNEGTWETDKAAH